LACCSHGDGALRVAGAGSAFDTLGQIDGKQVVDIKGTQTHPTTGHLDMTTVSQRDEPSLAEALTLWLSGQEQLMPRDLVLPAGHVGEDVDKPTTPISRIRSTAPSSRPWVI